MPPLDSPPKELSQKHLEKIVQYVSDIRNGKITGSDQIALTTLNLLEEIINESKNATAYELVSSLRRAGGRLSAGLPLQLVPANVARRLLRAVRDEHRAHCDQSAGISGGVEGAGESLQRLVLATAARRGTLGAAQPDLKEPLRDHIAELRAEFESSESAVSAQARRHVSAADVVLAAGHPAPAGLAAGHARLLLAEGPHHSETHAVALKLSQAGVNVTVINDASVAAVMPRVNKVILGVRGVLAGGALLASTGARALTTAALHYRVPVIALAPLYKLCPLHSVAPSADVPSTALPYHSAESGVAHVVAPPFEVVPAEHVTLFLTNLGGSSPSYIYRLLSELYDPQDHQL